MRKSDTYIEKRLVLRDSVLPVINTPVSYKAPNRIPIKLRPPMSTGLSSATVPPLTNKPVCTSHPTPGEVVDVSTSVDDV
ncbi:hypothetical protein OUZ56_007677 [Daphnia magna]|uniref:Uncharacterized protein n=1 Tax=Daphnia magna TaxID=35525 RepID=A0ABR0AB45_9CRUS|nr:hypothetical protein OUZ56_007677 [Daphnia magna]